MWLWSDEDANSKVLYIVADVGFVGIQLVLGKALETAHRQLAALHKLPLGRTILPLTWVSINLSFLQGCLPLESIVVYMFVKILVYLTNTVSVSEAKIQMTLLIVIPSTRVSIFSILPFALVLIFFLFFSSILPSTLLHHPELRLQVPFHCPKILLAN